ncbi:hypothetical protein A9A72_122459 [Stutzerimonas stutzeri]|uniref:Uncharacterized protein n=1 Tax=Stutzerimonas stutzeri TaxID=316 RepID=A0A5S5BE56_STUST|nr:hypothetical protein A9A72_122459 [Stutzerimonas stutzeri]
MLIRLISKRCRSSFGPIRTTWHQPGWWCVTAGSDCRAQNSSHWRSRTSTFRAGKSQSAELLCKAPKVLSRAREIDVLEPAVDPLRQILTDAQHAPSAKLEVTHLDNLTIGKEKVCLLFATQGQTCPGASPRWIDDSKNTLKERASDTAGYIKAGIRSLAGRCLTLQSPNG